MRCERKISRRLGSGVVGLAAFVVAFALPMPFLAAEDAGQSARAVRLGYVEGQVRVSQGGQVLADPAPANSPLFEGTQVAAGDDGRAEIQFEDGSVARLSPNSSLTLSVLRQEDGGNGTEIVLERGLGYFELQAAGGAGQVRVRFGDSVATATGFTVLRIGLDNGPGEVAVFSGNVHVERGNALALDLHGGESVSLNAADPSTYNLAESIEPDSWDAWNADRDRKLQTEYGAKTDATKSLAGSNNPAWADLDANGNWYNVPGQGYVWSPNDAANPGWDPYGNGNWMYNPGYGYIWVSGDPWGYMPYQCGAWNYYNSFGWGWAPGMGMCQPWWGGGSGWISRIGYAPSGYRLPVRPPARPLPPRRPTGNLPESRRLGTYPLIAVNRRPAGDNPVQPRNGPAVINGQTVQALRPVAPRQPFEHPTNGFLNRSGTTYQGYRPNLTPTPGNTANPAGNRPAFQPAPRPSGGQPMYAPSRPSGGQPAYAPSRSSSGGGVAPSHPSGGGGGVAPRGGGGAAPSGGGGGAPRGGGGGGAAPSGGGGPHH